MYTTLTAVADSAGILTATIDLPDRSMNVFTPELIADLDAIVRRLKDDAALRGLVITSGKPSFIAGADIKDLVTAYEGGITPRQAFDWSQTLSQLLRRVETVGKPVAAAINGLALGGGLELALACHYRVLADDPKAVLGLPEVKIGLLPGAGGTQRVPRLIGIAAAARFLTDGSPLPPAEALKIGLVHELAPAAETVARARAWIATGPEPSRRGTARGSGSRAARDS